MAEVAILHLSDLTGRASSINIPASAMAEAWVSHINMVEGGIFGDKGGVTLRLMVADTHYDVARAKESWARARDAGAIVAFHLMSGLAEGMIDDALRDKIPMVCGSWGLKGPWCEWYYGAGHPGLPDCTATGGVLGAREIAKSLGKPMPTKIGTMCSDLPFEPMFFIAIDDWMAKEGITIHREVFPAGAPDVTVNLARLKDAGVESIYGICTPADMATMIKDINRMGWDVPVNHSNCTGTADVAALIGWDQMQGVYFSTWKVPVDVAPEFQGPGHKFARELFAKYRPGEIVKDNAIYGLASLLVIKGAIETALDYVEPDKLTGATLKEFGLDKLTDNDQMGVCYDITYKPGNHHPGPNHAHVWMVKGEGLVGIGDWFEYTKIKPKVD